MFATYTEPAARLRGDPEREPYPFRRRLQPSHSGRLRGETPIKRAEVQRAAMMRSGL